MNYEKTLQIAAGLTLATIPAYVLYEVATRFRAAGHAEGSAENDAALYPSAVAVVMLLLLGAEIGRTIVLRNGNVQRLPSRAGLARAGVLFGLFLAYILFFPILGYSAATFGFLVAALAFLGVRPLWLPLAVAAGITLLIHLLFAQGLRMILPTGTIWGLS